MKPLRAVCFDIDGTLYPKWMFAVNMALMAFPSIALARRYRRFRATIRLEQENPTVPANQKGFRLRQARSILEQDDMPTDEHALEVLMNRIELQFYRRWDRKWLFMLPFRHLHKAMCSIRKHGMMIGVLSDFSIGRKLRALGVEDLVDISMCAEESGYLKPHAAPFDMLSQRLNVDSESILYVGDSYEKDIVGASRAGMTTCLIDPKARRADVREVLARRYPLADMIIGGYDELIHWFEESSTGGA